MKQSFILQKLFILSLIFCLTIQNFKLPIKNTKIIQDSQQQHENQSHLHKRHNLHSINKQQNYYKRKQHKSTSKLTHNIKYIKQNFNKNNKDNQYFQCNHHHNLRHNLHQNQHALTIQSFKLTPNFYSFSLPMIIGGYKYDMSIDSGSSDIFIKGQKSKGKPKKRYHCGQICIKSNQKYKIGYLDGQLRTYQTKLQVKLGQHIFNQSILVAYDVDSNFKQNQGLVGLSFPVLASNPNPTFIQNLINNKIIDHYAFGVNLNFQSKQRSFITFGSFDPQFFQGQLSYYPLTSDLFYNIDSKGVSFGNGKLLKINTAIFDTGNTCISIPAKYQKEMLKNFNIGKGINQNKCYFSVQSHAQMFSVLRCKIGNFDSLPTLNIILNDKMFPIQKQFYMQACDRRPKQQSENINNTFWYCDMYIQSVRGMSELFLGDGFFNRYYTYFDLENKQIAIAKNKQIITIQKIKLNKLDNSAQDWQQALTNLNPQQYKQNIKIQIQKADQNKKY